MSDIHSKSNKSKAISKTIKYKIKYKDPNDAIEPSLIISIYDKLINKIENINNNINMLNTNIQEIKLINNTQSDDISAMTKHIDNIYNSINTTKLQLNELEKQINYLYVEKEITKKFIQNLIKFSIYTAKILAISGSIGAIIWGALQLFI